MRLVSGILLIISFCAAFPAFARVGYFKPFEMPAAIAPKMSSVFRLVILSYDSVKTFPKAEFQTMMASRRGVERDILEQEWKDCAGRATCSTYLRGHGTAFLAKEGTTLWTARHNIESFVDRFQGENRFVSDRDLINRRAEIGLKVLVYDQDERLVFDTRRVEDIARLDFFIPQDCPNIVACSETDVVSIRLNRSLGTPLRFTEGSPLVGEAVYAVGFPKETSDRAKSARVPNSDGAGIFVSMGNTIAPKACDRAAALKLDLEKVDRNLLFFDADVVGGNSGGPVFDAHGSVVSVVIGNWCRSAASVDQYTGAGAVGVRPEWLNNLADKFAKVFLQAIRPAAAGYGFK